MDSKRKKIRRVLKTVQDSELSKLAEMVSQRNAIRQGMEELRSNQKKSVQSNLKTTEPAHWEYRENYAQWIDAQMKIRNLSLAKISADIEIQKQKTRLAVGKSNAFEKAIKIDRVGRSF